jgi:hypothetical protein
LEGGGGWEQGAKAGQTRDVGGGHGPWVMYGHGHSGGGWGHAARDGDCCHNSWRHKLQALAWSTCARDGSLSPRTVRPRGAHRAVQHATLAHQGAVRARGAGHGRGDCLGAVRPGDARFVAQLGHLGQARGTKQPRGAQERGHHTGRGGAVVGTVVAHGAREAGKRGGSAVGARGARGRGRGGGHTPGPGRAGGARGRRRAHLRCVGAVGARGGCHGARGTEVGPGARGALLHQAQVGGGGEGATGAGHGGGTARAGRAHVALGTWPRGGWLPTRTVLPSRAGVALTRGGKVGEGRVRSGGEGIQGGRGEKQEGRRRARRDQGHARSETGGGGRGGSAAQPSRGW